MRAESGVTNYARRDGPCVITEYIAFLSGAVVARRDDGSDALFAEATDLFSHPVIQLGGEAGKGRPGYL
jgi:hypothetical protein